ncbi:hypothetical protein G7Z17_g12987 [Cylindrodendrum hubeiense]|uniref:Uncharacterized protein n=1 Tax=Cylindrodendrum hubeiense TaxID=595255 RepID=A0A9P5GXU7_9HYPO|nr:hypothetical protein G7Z17_g12987 [Cylindrodendrum hubeiense]
MATPPALTPRPDHSYQHLPPAHRPLHLQPFFAKGRIDTAPDMFAAPHYSETMSEAQRKRAREEEEDAGNGSMSFGEHRNKRVQCLPLRTSPRVSQQWLPPSSMTPQNSDSDDQPPQSHFSPWSSSMGMSSQPQQYVDMDMMSMTSQEHQNHPADATNSQSDNANGRMPTPIQPSFAAQVRGQQCEWAGPGPAVTSLNGIVNLGHQQTGFSDEQCVPLNSASSSAWQAVQNNRRLPSPISEGDDSMFSQAIASPGMSFDMGIPIDESAEFEYIAPQPSPPHAMEHPNAMMDVESESPPQAADEEDPTTPSPNRRGHTRSRHTVNNWTWQPGMKKSFSIGYRVDCEKCRLKVPGHFNHIIVSQGSETTIVDPKDHATL